VRPQGPILFQSLRLASAQQTLVARICQHDSQQLVGSGTIRLSPGGAIVDPTPLNVLNGGAGVQPGVIRVTDRSGASTNVDLSNAYTVDDVASAINNANGISVNASVSGDHLVLADASGQTADQPDCRRCRERAHGQRSWHQGIRRVVDFDRERRSTRRRLRSTLSSLNDGNQVIWRRAASRALAIQLTDVSATSLNVDLTGAATLGDVVAAINNATNNSGKLTASIANRAESC